MNSEIARATELLLRDALVAIPTETVYGLAGNALSDRAVARIYEAKGRPAFNPLIVHVSSLEQAMQYADFNDVAARLARHFWPGPLTLVLPRKPGCALSLLTSAGLDSIALRIPSHPLALELLRESNLPLAAPSANRSGRISPTSARHVYEELADKVSLILDGGDCRIGIESTVVDACGELPAILRRGMVSRESIQQLLGRPISTANDTTDTPKSPGMLQSHYAPQKPLRLNAHTVSDDEALLAFGVPLPGAMQTAQLSASRNLEEAAANLFRMLRELDATPARAIAAMPIPMQGLGEAINDRLQRAAS